LLFEWGIQEMPLENVTKKSRPRQKVVLELGLLLSKFRAADAFIDDETPPRALRCFA
jgi:hypothetical protein